MAVTRLTESFQEVTGLIIKSSSMLKMYPLLKDQNNITFLDIFRSFSVDGTVLANQNIYELYTVSQGDWWENIAYKYYQNTKLWWVITMFNQTNNPFEQLIEGQTIKVLKAQYLPTLYTSLGIIAEL